MMTNDKIYIAVSGCKNGYSVLYTSPGLDVARPRVAQSLCDMRRCLRISTPLIDYYSLEFIPGFRVCTQYRSSIDSAGANGAYIAISLFIPDRFMLPGVLPLLNEMMNAYFADYYHPQFGSPLPGKIESGARQEAILQARCADISIPPLHYSLGESRPDELPLYMGCKDEAELGMVIQNPYRSEYLSGSKLIILTDDMLKRPGAYRILFNTDVHTTRVCHETLSNRLRGRLLPINQPGCRMITFALNGVDYTANYLAVCLVPDDRISFCVLLPNEQKFNYAGTVADALKSRYLSAAQSAAYKFGFFPFELTLVLRGLEGNPSPSQLLLPTIQQGGVKLPVRYLGNATAVAKITSQPHADALVLADENGNTLPLINNFLTPNTDFRAPITLEYKKLAGTFPTTASVKAEATSPTVKKGPRFVLPPSRGSLTLFVPAVLPSESLIFTAGSSRWCFNDLAGRFERLNPGRKLSIWVWIAAAVTVVCVAVALFLLLSPAKEEPTINILPPPSISDSAATLDEQDLEEINNAALSGDNDATAGNADALHQGAQAQDNTNKKVDNNADKKGGNTAGGQDNKKGVNKDSKKDKKDKKDKKGNNADKNTGNKAANHTEAEAANTTEAKADTTSGKK